MFVLSYKFINKKKIRFFDCWYEALLEYKELCNKNLISNLNIYDVERNINFQNWKWQKH